jgi:hypothetical protein
MVKAAFALFGGRHVNAMFTIGSEYTVTPGQVHLQLEHLRSQFGCKIK